MACRPNACESQVVSNSTLGADIWVDNCIAFVSETQIGLESSIGFVLGKAEIFSSGYQSGNNKCDHRSLFLVRD